MKQNQGNQLQVPIKPLKIELSEEEIMDDLRFGVDQQAGDSQGLDPRNTRR